MVVRKQDTFHLDVPKNFEVWADEAGRHGGVEPPSFDNRYYPIMDDSDWFKEPKQKCLHDQCSECHGKGEKKNGERCIHMISCSCPRCTSYSY